MMSKAWDGSIRTTDCYQPFTALTCEVDASMHSNILDDVKHLYETVLQTHPFGVTQCKNSKYTLRVRAIR